MAMKPPYLEASEGCGGIHKRMQELRLACQQEIGAHRDEAAAAVSSSFRRALFSAPSLVQENLTHREKLTGLKDRLRQLEIDLMEALTAKAVKESRHATTGESLSATAARNEELKKIVADQRAKKDEYAQVISNQLTVIESLEAKSNEDTMAQENLEEAITWYNNVVGFRVIGGEGVKFIFNKLDLERPEKEYSFSVKLDGDKYCLLHCNPSIEDADNLMEDLNRTNDLFKFVRFMREKFQAATSKGALHATNPVLCLDSSSVTVSSPPPASVESRSEVIEDQTRSPSQVKRRATHPKRGALVQQSKSQSMSPSVRRSPRVPRKVQ